MITPASRESPDELGKVLQPSDRVGRHGARDRAPVLLAYRHGLRVGELVALRWDQVDLKAGLLHVARLKNGIASTHPLRGPELRALRELRRQYPDSPYVFVTERGGPLTPGALAGSVQGVLEGLKVKLDLLASSDRYPRCAAAAFLPSGIRCGKRTAARAALTSAPANSPRQ